MSRLVRDLNVVGEWVSASPSGNSCVELTELAGGNVAVRDSKEPDGTALVFTREEIGAFLIGAAAGVFDRFGLPA